MTEKGPTNKESRHESAKTKYQHYQRVLSCKNLMKNVAPITPSPGQFIVENNKPVQLPTLNESKSYSLLLTKNIRNIVQKPNPVTFSEMLSEVVSKKTLKIAATEKNKLKREIQSRNRTTEGENEPYFKRPISAKIYHETQGKQIEESQMLRQAFEYDRKMKQKQQTLRKNYFQVKPKLKIPKHIHGYNTVVIEQKSLLSCQNIEEQSLASEVEKQLTSLNYRHEKNFLPTEYYFSEPLKPEELIQKYKNQNGIIFGFSKWFHNDGKNSWRRCRILRYDQSEERWEIQWLGSGIVKKVSRNNLYFEKENFQEFQKAVEAAENFRKRSEIYMKYNILISLINTPTPNLSQQSQQKIKSLTNFVLSKNKNKGEMTKYESQLLEEAKKMYARACHQFEFNSMLPYNMACKKMFGEVLPEQMFDANPRKMMVDDRSKIQTISRSQCSQLFNSGLKKIKEKSFLNSEKKIMILELINILNEELSSIDLLKDYKRIQQRVYSVDEINTILTRNISEYFYKINCRVCDIQHLVSKQLDPLYANKKLIQEQTYNSTIGRYEKFLTLANMKIQIFLREATSSVISNLVKAFPSFKTCAQTNCEQVINWDVIFLQEKQDLKIIVETSIKEEKLQITPSPSSLSQVIIKNIQRILTELKNIKCISKTYLPEIRPNNILEVTNPSYDSEQIQMLNSAIQGLKDKLKVIEENFEKYFNCLALKISEIFELNSEITKKSQKKSNSYGDIEEFIQKINQCEQEINKMIKIEQFDLCGMFKMDFQEVKSTISVKISQTMKEVVNMLIDKIYKDNEKMDKNVAATLETMLKVPNTIAEFVQLETFVIENVKEEIEKSHAKAKMLTEKMNLLEKTSQTIEYRQFESCCQIYLKPLRLQKAREEVMHKLQNVYKKNFAEELMKDSYSVLDNIRVCEKMFAESLCNKTLEDMDKNFNVFSQLNASIQSSCQKMSSINEKEALLKWSKTNFDRLLEVKEEFEPYYKLITLHKNYRLNLLPLLDEAFTQINYQIISNNVTSSFDTLKFLHTHKFNGNSTYEPITESILKEYQEFNSYLPLIKALRNPDLRDRHWIIIQNITGVDNIRGEEITLKEILSEDIRSQSEELYKISQIATKELIYQKSLNQLKKEWKDVRITMKEVKIGNETYKFIKNIGEIEKKLENDMLEVNNILASSFIKFLEADVTHWKSLVLEKVYEFVNYWPGFESKIVFYLRLLNSSKMSEYFQSTSTAHKNLQKFWKQFITNAEYQSIMVDIANTRTWQSISSLEYQMDEIQRIISEFLEEKKKMNSKLRLFSDDALISMMVEINSESALESMKKCFTGAKSFKFIDEPGFQNIEIMSTLDQKILVILEDKCSKTDIKTEKNLTLYTAKELSSKNIYQFDELLLSIDRQLKKQIKTTFLSSLRSELNENDLLCQVQLLKSRLIFKNKMEELFLASKSLDVYELELTAQQNDYITSIKNRVAQKGMIKIWSLHIIELLNQLNLVQKLSQTENPMASFEWYKYPKYELADATTINNPKLKINIGAYTREYMFELVQCQNFVVNPLCDAVFVNLCTSLQEKMIPMLQGAPGSSKVLHLEFFGQLLGRNVTEICCSELSSPQNLLEYLKIASSGIFIILSEIQKLSTQCLSAFNQSMSTFWINYQLSRININSFKIKSQEFILDVPNFTLVGICRTLSPLLNVSSFRQCFRTFALVPIQCEFLLKCALLSVGVTEVDETFVLNVKDILEELNYQRMQSNILGMNRNIFLWQISSQFLTMSNENQGQEELLWMSLQNVLQMYLPFEGNSSSRIWKNLSELKLITRTKCLPFKKIDLNQEDQDEKVKNQISLERNIQKLNCILNFHCGAIVTGPILSGKSTLINKLLLSEEGKKRYNFGSINPKAYTIEELYEGISQKVGIIRQLIDEIKIRACGLLVNHEVVNGIYFDSQIGDWTEPLLSIANKPDASQLSCPDGSLLNLPPAMKLIFETDNLAKMAPSSFHSMGILNLNQQINWKSLLPFYYQKHFSKHFEKTPNAQFIKSLLLQTFEPALEFYHSIHKEKSSLKSDQMVLANPIIFESFMKFFSLIYHKEDVGKITSFNEQEVQPQKEAEERIRSEIFSIYTYSLLATLGLLIPEESRKTFSRHFKYVLEQSPLGRYGWKNNSILNKDEECIYDFVYEKGQWCKWKSQKSLNATENIVSGHYRVLQKVLQHHIENGNSCFLIGEECSSKNYIFKNYISELKTEKFTKNYFACSNLTKKHNISNKIAEMIFVEKYSRKINGFSNCKKNLIYIQDLNMATLSQCDEENASIIEFMKEFYREKTWYIEGSLYGFSNLQFYGTLNQNLKLPAKILRYINPILMSQPENRVQSILEMNIKSSPISSFEKELIIRCTLNLQDVLLRDLAQSPIGKEKQSFINNFNLRDMVRVIRGVSKITESISSFNTLTMHSLLRYWVYVVDKVYSQKINYEKKSFLFYLVNNVLMEQERVRYRTICPSSNFYVLGFKDSLLSSSKNIKQNYESSTIQELVLKIKKLATNAPQKYKYVSMFPEENIHQIAKVMVKLANSFDFQSKIVIVFNDQRRKMTPILKMLGLINYSMVFETFEERINGQILIKDEIKIEKSLNSSFTKAFYEHFGNPEVPVSKFTSAFQSQFQSKNKIDNEFDQKPSSDTKFKNRVIFHIKDLQQSEKLSSKDDKSNFILEDLLSYRKLNRYPRWMIPKEDSYEEGSEFSQTSINKRSTVFQRYVSNRDSHQVSKQLSEREQLCKNLDINVVLQYNKSPQYLFKNYLSLVNESSLIFLRNPSPQPALISKTTKVIMTDVKFQEELQEDFQENIELKKCSQKEILKLATSCGLKVYIDLTFDMLRQYFDKNWHNTVASRPVTFKNSFRNIFNKFSSSKKEKSMRKLKIEDHLTKTNSLIEDLKTKLESNLKQESFILNQNNIKLSEIKSKIEKEQERYTTQKKKITETKEKIQKKQLEYEQNLHWYRQTMDKFAFEFSKAREKLVKVIVQFQNAKFNIANAMSVENKLMIEGLACALFIVDLKKSEDVSILALREFMKLLKDKKISKILSKTTIETVPSKALSRIEKIVQQMEILIGKGTDSSKKLPQSNPNDENSVLKQSLIQFLQACLISGREFSNPKVKQCYDTIQSTSKVIEKWKADQSKKEKSKAIKELFENYNAFTEQSSKLQLKSKETASKIEQISEILEHIEHLSANGLPKLTENLSKEALSEEEKESTPLIMTICVRYFNELYHLSQSQLEKLFSNLQASLTQFQVPSSINSFPNLATLPKETVINSLFTFRGFILFQSSNETCSSSLQTMEMAQKAFLNGKSYCRLKSDQFLSSSSSNLELSNAEIIVVSVAEKKKRTCIGIIEEILSLKDEEEMGKTIIIEAPFFSEQHKCNYPYIDFITGFGVSLSYQEVYDKCKISLYDSIGRPKKTEKDEEDGQQIKERAGQSQANCESVVSKFMMFNMDVSEDLGKVKQSCIELKAILAPFSQSKTKILEDPAEKQMNLTESVMTDKQKQKQFLEHKTCQFFSRLFIIFQHFHRNGQSKLISIDNYLQAVQKVVKGLANCNIVIQGESTAYKYIARIGKELREFVEPLQGTFLANLICNAKMTIFGNVENYQRYVQLFIEACFEKNVTRIQSQQNRKETVKMAFEKLKACVPSLSHVCEQVALDFQFWIQDVNNIYKEEKDPPVEWLYLMLIADRERFWSVVNQIEKRAIQKMSNDPDFFEHVSAKEKLQGIINAPARAICSPVTPIFLQSSHCLHAIVNVLQDKKIEFEFIDIKKYLEKEKAKACSTIQSRKSNKTTVFEEDIIAENNKLFITFIRSSEVDLVNDFMECLQAKHEAKRSKSTQQDQPIEIKLVVLNPDNDPHPPAFTSIKNCIYIKEALNCNLGNLIELYQAPVKHYSVILKDKTKLREYEQLPAKTKRTIYQIFLMACEAVVGLCYRKGTDFYWIIHRCLQVVQKMMGKANKCKGQQKEPNWKLILKQIIYENAEHQSEQIGIKLKKLEKQSIKIVEEGQQKEATTVRESESYRKLFRILLACFKEECTRYLGNRIDQEVRVDGSKKQFSGDRVHEILHFLRRKSAIESSMPLSNFTSVLELVPISLSTPNSFRVPNFTLRPQLQNLGMENNKQNTVQITVIKQQQQAKLSKTKGILIENPTHSLHPLYIKQQIFLANFISYGMGQHSYIADC